MGKIQFLMDTSNHCFLCLKLATSTSPPSTGGTDDDPSTSSPQPPPGREPPRTYSFRNICKYLRIDLKDVCEEAMPVSTSSLRILESSELKGVVCSNCAPAFELFSRHYLELDEIKLKVRCSLNWVYENMMKVEAMDEEMDLEEFRREKLLRQQTSLKNGFVEQLRRKTLERCSIMIETGRPQLVLDKVGGTKPPRKRQPRPPETNDGPEPEVITLDDEDTDGGDGDGNNMVGQEEVVLLWAIPEGSSELNVGQLLTEATQNHVAVQEMIMQMAGPSTSSSQQVTVQNGALGDSEMEPVHILLNGQGHEQDNSASVLHQPADEAPDPNDGSLKCDHCDRTFKQLNNLRRHQQATHSGQKYSCQYCSKSFKDNGARARHAKSFCPVRYPPQAAEGVKEVSHEEPSSSSPPGADGTFGCFICLKTFPLSREWHPHGKKKLCHPCHEKFEERSIHIRRKGMSPKQDNIFGPQPRVEHAAEVSTSQDTLVLSQPSARGVGNGHITESQTSVIPSSDPAPLPNLFISMPTLTATENGNFLSPPPPPPNDKVPLPPRSSAASPTPSQSAFFEFECDICHTSFPTRKAQYEHQRGKHAGMKFGCDYCPMTFVHVVKKHRHIETCPKRPQTAPSPGDSRSRELRSSSKIREIKEAQKTEKQKSVRKAILQDPEAPPPPPPQAEKKRQSLPKPESDTLPCRESSAVEALMLISQVDDNGQPDGGQTCAVCGKTFRSKKQLRRHSTIIHGATTKFECEFCQKTFRSKQGVHLHRQTTHFRRRFHCQYCSMEFATTSSRNRHMKRTCPDIPPNI